MREKWQNLTVTKRLVCLTVNRHEKGAKKYRWNGQTAREKRQNDNMPLILLSIKAKKKAGIIWKAD